MAGAYAVALDIIGAIQGEEEVKTFEDQISLDTQMRPVYHFKTRSIHIKAGILSVLCPCVI